MAQSEYRYQHYYSPNSSPQPQPSPPHRRPKPAQHPWLVVCMITLGIAGLYVWGWRPHVHSQPVTKYPTTTKPAITAAQMNSQIQGIIAAHSDVDISVSCIDLTSGTTYHWGVTDSFEAASVGKLITATAFLHSVEAGSSSLNVQIEGGSAQYQLQQMIVNSDNGAWQALSDNISLQGLDDYAIQIDLTTYDASSNTVSSSDIAMLLQKLYKGTLLNQSHTKLLLGYMKRANEADYISVAVPNGITVYHKADLLDDRVHDAAIITNGSHPYVLVIFTNGHGTYDLGIRTQILRSITTSTTKFFLT